MLRTRKSLAIALSSMFLSGGLMLSPVCAADTAAHQAAAGNAANAQQVDQQVNQQLQKIQQAKDNLAGDRLFVLNTALGNQFEVSVAQIAQQKSQDQHVKQIAQQLIQDHTQASQQLSQVAQKLQLELPQGLTQMKQQELQIIGGMDSKMFDQAFISMMDEHHAKDVTCFRNKTATAQSPEVKQFAAQTLPKLQQHWQMIKQSATALGLPAENEAQPAGAHVPASGAHSSSGAQSTPGSGTSAGSSAGTSGTGTSGTGSNTGTNTPSGNR